MIRIGALLLLCAGVACVLDPDVIQGGGAQQSDTDEGDEGTSSQSGSATSVADETGTAIGDPCGALCECNDSCSLYCDTLTRAGCQFTCDAANECNFECEGGGCITQCDAATSCNLDCAGGGCAMNCDDSGTCEAQCGAAGGSCLVDCSGTSECLLDCPGGNCTLTCSDATRCQITSCTTGCILSCTGTTDCDNSCTELAAGCITSEN